MPGGSKKGEHRGQAKREAKRRGPKLGTVNNPRGRPSGPNKATTERLAVIAQEIGVSELSGLMPKAMMLSIARTFMGMALIEQQKLLESPDQELNQSYERHLVLAGDMAFKCGAFYHPRLQALAVAGDFGSGNSPRDVLKELLNEIDVESRQERQQSRQIEHKPASDEILDLVALKTGTDD